MKTLIRQTVLVVAALLVGGAALAADSYGESIQLFKKAGETPCNSARSRLLGGCSRGPAIQRRQCRAYSTPAPLTSR